MIIIARRLDTFGKGYVLFFADGPKGLELKRKNIG